GLQVVSGARLAGAGVVITVDPDPDKLRRARDRGATETLHVSETNADIVSRVHEICADGVDVAIEVVGLPETIRQAFDLVRPGGTAVVVGIAPRGVEVPLPAIDFISDKTI